MSAAHDSSSSTLPHARRITKRRRRAIIWRQQRQHAGMRLAIALRELRPPTRNAVDSASASAALAQITLALKHALGGPARSRIDDVPVSPAVDDRRTARRRRWCRARHRAARRARSAGRVAATRYRSGQPRPRPPIASRLLCPADSSASTTARVAKQSGDAIERVALADRAEIQLDAGLREISRSSVRDRAAPCASRRIAARARSRASDGTRPSRRRKPQQRLSGVLVMSKAPSVARRQLAAARQQREQIGGARRRPMRGAAVQLGNRAAVAKHGELRFDGVDLVERRLSGRHARGIVVIERDFEAGRPSRAAGRAAIARSTPRDIVREGTARSSDVNRSAQGNGYRAGAAS